MDPWCWGGKRTSKKRCGCLNSGCSATTIRAVAWMLCCCSAVSSSFVVTLFAPSKRQSNSVPLP
eukprot:5805742-Prorocentrum_lima.AAC.1